MGTSQHIILNTIYSQSSDEIVNELKAMDSQKQNSFVEAYNRQKRGTGLTYLFRFFGFHYLYLQKWAIFAAYFLTIGGFGIWALIDLFRIPGLVRRYNETVAKNIINDRKSVNTQDNLAY